MTPLDSQDIISTTSVMIALVMIVMTATVYEDYNKSITNYNLCVDYSRGFAEYIGSNDTFNRYVSDRLQNRIIPLDVPR